MLTSCEKLQLIYDSERNVTLTWFWDGGIQAKIGDEANGVKCFGTFQNVTHAVDWLFDAAFNLNSETREQWKLS